MGVNKIAIGRTSEATAPDAWKAAFAELIATFLFVFIGVGACIANTKIEGGDLTPAGLVSIAIAHGLAIVVTVAATASISGGHVNPAVTFGLMVGGHITVLRAALYWIGQLVGATLACYLLQDVIASVGEAVPTHGLGDSVTVIGGLVLEIVISFSLVFVVYATAVDPKKGSIGTIAPLAIGFTVLANHFIGVPYTGASMNPARSFGPAVVAWDFHNHWIYWVGPLVGGAIAGVVYGEVFIAPESGHAPVASDEY